MNGHTLFVYDFRNHKPDHKMHFTSAGEADCVRSRERLRELARHAKKMAPESRRH